MACAELRGDTHLYSLAKYDKDDIRVNPPADPAQMPKGLFEKTHMSFLTRGKNLTTHLLSKEEARLYYSTLQLGVIGGVSNREKRLLLSSENRTFLVKWWITNLLAERYRGKTVVDPPVVSRRTHARTHAHAEASADDGGARRGGDGAGAPGAAGVGGARPQGRGGGQRQ